MIIACATDNGIEFCNRHFGDAEFYAIYEINKNSISFINRVENTTEEEKRHSDPVKAKNIIEILKEHNVEVAYTKIFGPNIKRIVKKILPIVSNTNSIEDGIIELQKNYDVIVKLLNSEKNCYFDLKNNKEVYLNE